MDIYFCDECGTRVTDLDLRAGKGMRKRHDTICAGCVDQGLAGSWLARAGQQAAASVGGRVQPSAALAVAEAPDPISIARDRARTVPDDPFAVDEPVAIKPLPKPGTETDAIPAVPPKPAKTVTPMDGLAAAGGGFGALVGSSMPPPPPGLVDDPEDADKGIEVADGPLVAQSDSPFDFVHPKDNDNPGKAETAEVVAVDKNDEPKEGDEAKPARTASGRQQSQKRGSTATSKRGSAKTPSTRRSGSSSSRAKNNKVILFSLLSCAAMLVVFTLVMLNRGGPRKPGEVIHDQPLTVLKDYIEKARRDSNAAMGSDDLAVIQRAIASVHSMQEEFRTFQSKAKNWDEDAHGEQLKIMGYYDVQATLRDLNQRKVIVEMRGKP
jgi:hypothetical protein